MCDKGVTFGHYLSILEFEDECETEAGRRPDKVPKDVRVLIRNDNTVVGTPSKTNTLSAKGPSLLKQTPSSSISSVIVASGSQGAREPLSGTQHELNQG